MPSHQPNIAYHLCSWGFDYIFIYADMAAKYQVVNMARYGTPLVQRRWGACDDTVG